MTFDLLLLCDQEHSVGRDGMDRSDQQPAWTSVSIDQRRVSPLLKRRSKTLGTGPLSVIAPPGVGGGEISENL